VVNEGGGDLIAVANKIRKLVAPECEGLRRLLGKGVSRRCDHPGIREDTPHVPSAPLHNLAQTGSAVNIDGHLALEEDVKTPDNLGVTTDALSLLEVPRGGMGCDPDKFLARCSSEQTVSNQAINEFMNGHTHSFLPNPTTVSGSLPTVAWKVKNPGSGLRRRSPVFWALQGESTQRS